MAAKPLCPSAAPDWPSARLIGVVGGTPEAPVVRYLEDAVPVTPSLLDLAAPLRPTEIFRFTAPCTARACGHFGEGRCRLAAKVVALLPEATHSLPPCPIRDACQWFGQEGPPACARCPQLITHDPLQSPPWQRAADTAQPPPG